MPFLIAILGRLGLSQGLSRLVGYLIPIALVAGCVGFLWLRGAHYRDQRNTARAQLATVNAKLAVSNASNAELQKNLADYVGAGKAAKVAQLGAVEAQAKDNAALQGQADAIRAEVATIKPDGKCATPASVKSAKGL